MIYLISGVPGSGKTLYMISMLLKRDDLKNRPLYLSGIDGVDSEVLPHKQIPEGHSVENWYDWIEPGAILVVDEAQRHFRKSNSQSNVPKHITELETHRHYGIDIFLITQHPRLLHVNVKSFVENHVHISKTQLGTRRIWEWQGCGNPDSMQSRSAALFRPYKLDKSVFGLYKSAEVHTKIKTKKSILIYVLPLLLIGFIFSSYTSVQKVKAMLNQDDSTDTAIASAVHSTATESAGTARAGAGEDARAAVSASAVDPNTITPADYVPQMHGKPWTAPVYGRLNGKQNIQTMPFPVACVADSQKCTCYTEQATAIREMDEGLCRDFVENGIYNEFKMGQQNIQTANAS